MTSRKLSGFFVDYSLKRMGFEMLEFLFNNVFIPISDWKSQPIHSHFFSFQKMEAKLDLFLYKSVNYSNSNFQKQR